MLLSSNILSSVVILELLNPALIPKFKGDCALTTKDVANKKHNTANVFMVILLKLYTK
jgi:hypothetical protein